MRLFMRCPEGGGTQSDFFVCPQQTSRHSVGSDFLWVPLFLRSWLLDSDWFFLFLLREI